MFNIEICTQVYNLYLNGVCIDNISNFLDLNVSDVDEIIDYMNEIYN